MIELIFIFDIADLIFFYFRSVMRNTILFSSDVLVEKVTRSVTVTHSWEDAPYWQHGDLTGIPAHIVIYVNQERIIEHITKTMNTFADALYRDLDQRQLGGGNLTIELLREQITKPLENQISTLRQAVDNVATSSPENGNETVSRIEGGTIETTVNNFYFWNRDNKTHLLPEDFSLDPGISCFLIWQQWHRGMTLSGRREICPLKNIPNKDYPASERMFKRLRRYCDAIDKLIQPVGDEGIFQLNTKFQEKKQLLMQHKLLLPKETDVGRKRTRQGELHWSYVAMKYEEHQALLKKSIETGRPVVELKEEARIKTAARKKREREDRKRQRSGSTNVENINDGQPRRVQAMPLHGVFGDARTTASAVRLLT